MQYSEVVELITQKRQENDLRLLVANRNTLLWYKENELPVKNSERNIRIVLTENLEHLANDNETEKKKKVEKKSIFQLF
jgi:hypothetical protein